MGRGIISTVSGCLFFIKLLHPVISSEFFGCIILHKVVESMCEYCNLHNSFSVFSAQKGQPFVVENRKGMTFGFTKKF
jgi:hypothetical protein